MNEEDIYVETKYFLKSLDWIPIAGDPPRGTDIPRLEIKKPGEVQSLTKNKDSIINDLVFCKNGYLSLIENKPSYRHEDVTKLRRAFQKPEWRESIVTALEKRGIDKKYSSNIDIDGIKSGEKIVKVVAYQGIPQKNLSDFVQIGWLKNNEKPEIRVGTDLKELENLFELN